MKRKMINLANIQEKMSRAEMKKIMAGSGGGCLGILACTVSQVGEKCTNVGSQVDCTCKKSGSDYVCL